MIKYFVVQIERLVNLLGLGREGGREISSRFYKIKGEVSEHSRFFSLISDSPMTLVMSFVTPEKKTKTNQNKT